MATSLSKIADNLREEIWKIKWKDFACVLEYESVENNLIKDKCSYCHKDNSDKIYKELKKRFKNTFKFSNNYFDKFILLLRKGVYPYEFMDD